MRALILTQYFPPETGGPQNRLASLAEGLSARGHEVTVITAKPSYPAGVVFNGFEDGFFVSSRHRGVSVVHTWILPDDKKTTLRRLGYYLSFMLSSVLAAWREEGDVDVVLASSPPLFVGIAGWLASRLKRARFVFDVRDLWPDVAVAMGELDDGWLAGAARAIERFIYRRADGITAVTKGFCEDIEQRAARGTPVVRITNGTEPEVFRVAAGRRSLREALDLPDGFLVTYAGNLGLAQGLDHVLEAADRLAAEEPDVTLLLVGDGPRREELSARATDGKLDNVVFRDRVPLKKAARYMAASDALLVPLGDRRIYRKFIPSKLFDAMAAGRPVLLSVDGEAREILEEAGAGLYYPAEDADGLAAAIRSLRSHSCREAMGPDGRAFVERRYTRSQQARKMARFLEERIVDEVESVGAA